MMANAEDLLPPVQGGSTEVQTKEEISEPEDGVIEAKEIMQDAFNYASQVIKDNKQGNGFFVVKQGDDIGYIGAATSEYLKYENVNASLVAKRSAYLQAYYKAKANLIEGMRGFLVEHKVELEETLLILDDEEQNIGSYFMRQKEELEKVVNGLIRGYVTYEVSEEESAKTGSVYVSLIITPHTLATVNQVGHSVLIGKDYLSVLNIVTANLENDVEVPVGGKIILLPEQNKFALIGFGSAIARYSEDPLLSVKYKKAAYEESRLRAVISMMEIFKGTDESWTMGITDITKIGAGTEQKDLKEINNNVENIEGEDTVLENMFSKLTAKEFLDVIEKNDLYNYYFTGTVPPGTVQKTYDSVQYQEDGYGWVYSIAVFYPELDSKTKAINEDLDIVKLIKEAKEEIK